MEKNLENYRLSYEKDKLRREDLEEKPMHQFENWFRELEQEVKAIEVNAMTLGSIGLDGFPKNRVVLMKKYSSEGFVFFTNYESEKGRSIRNNPKVCLSFYWPVLERQVIVKGFAEKVPENFSDHYFASRPLESRLSAIVSKQSEPVENRENLEKKFHDLKEKLSENEIKRPENWGGILIKPISMEFWQGRKNRLHDRFLYSLENNKWKIERLAP